MPVNTINQQIAINLLRPLSRAWTYYRVASEVMVLTNTVDNEEIELDNIRHHINLNISYIADLLSLASSPWYGVYLAADLEAPGTHPSGIDYIDLSSGGVGLDVSNFLHHIASINAPYNSAGAATLYVGNCVGWDVGKLTQQAANMNLQHKDTIAWAHHGIDVMFFVGNNIAAGRNTGIGTPYYTVAPTNSLTIFAFRNPMLDDLCTPLVDLATGDGISTSQTFVQRTPGAATLPPFTEYVDLPDRYMKLLVDMVQSMVLQQLQRPIPNNIEQSVNQGIMQLTEMLDKQKQAAAQERMRAAYGSQKG